MATETQTEVETLINESVLRNAAVKTSGEDVYLDLLTAADDDCDTSEQQVGEHADGSPRMGVRFWGQREDGGLWSVIWTR